MVSCLVEVDSVSVNDVVDFAVGLERDQRVGVDVSVTRFVGADHFKYRNQVRQMRSGADSAFKVLGDVQSALHRTNASVFFDELDGEDLTVGGEDPLFCFFVGDNRHCGLRGLGLCFALLS